MTSSNFIKYPRTMHLPWSEGLSSDDKVISSLAELEELDEVVITEKMDGENTTMYPDHIHARSINSKPHPSRDWVKALHGKIKHIIPAGWRICGENLFAKHSIGYETLPSFFMVFSIWDASGECLSWDDTVVWCEILGLELVPLIYRGKFNSNTVKEIDKRLDLSQIEGYVVRNSAQFPLAAFPFQVAKFVRKNHVQTDEHWLNSTLVPNKLKK